VSYQWYRVLIVSVSQVCCFPQICSADAKLPI